MRAVVFALAAVLLSAPAFAAEDVYVKVDGERARLLACFKEEKVGASYSVKHVLLRPAQRKYVKRLFGRVQLVEIPALYVEERTLIEPEHIVLRQVPCK